MVSADYPACLEKFWKQRALRPLLCLENPMVGRARPWTCPPPLSHVKQVSWAPILWPGKFHEVQVGYKIRQFLSSTHNAYKHKWKLGVSKECPSTHIINSCQAIQARAITEAEIKCCRAAGERGGLVTTKMIKVSWRWWDSGWTSEKWIRTLPSRHKPGGPHAACPVASVVSNSLWPHGL